MHAGSHRYTGTTAGLLLAAVFAESLFTWDQNVVQDDPMDDLISPWCRVGSLASWEGRPCALSLRTGSIEAAAHPR